MRCDKTGVINVILSVCSIAGHEAMLRDENSLMPLQLATIQSDTQTGHACLEAGAFVCRLCNSEARAANHWIAGAGACKALKAEVTACRHSRA